MPLSVTDTSFKKEVLDSPLPVLVDFWAPWCGPCKAMLPVVEELETAYEGKAKVVKVNVDESAATAAKYDVMSIPTFILFVNGKAGKSFVGARAKEDLKKELDAVTS